jgi:signal transduction histidine kinase
MPCPEQDPAPDRGWLEGRGPPADPQRRHATGDLLFDVERLLVEDRARIGHDLHDLVIRRLFTVSLKLSSALAMIERKEAGDRVEAAIVDLDQTVKLIRSVVFALERGSPPTVPPAARAAGRYSGG